MIIPLPLPALTLALLCDAVFGDPDWLYRRIPHPVVLMGRGIGALDRAWNRPASGAVARMLWGGFAVTTIVCLSGAAGMIVTAVTNQVPGGWVVDAVLISVLLAQNSLYRHVRAVATALEDGGLPAGREAVGRIVGRETARLDEAGVSRSAIESLAENFSDGVVAPAFWAALFGLPGILAYKALNTADSMIGHRNERYRHFGRVAARMDDVANFIPARLSGLLLACAATISANASSRAAFRIMRRDARRHRSVNAGVPEAAMAGALGVRLSGPRAYDGAVVDEPWIGEGRDATPADIATALRLYVRACAILFAIVAVGALMIPVPS